MRITMKKIVIKQKSSAKVSQGYPLIQKNDLQNPLDSQEINQWVNFTSPQGTFLGTGYIGEQNKGIGWILTQDKKIEINSAFFRQKFVSAIVKRQQLATDLETTAYRLFNGEGDGLGGLTIDLYNEYALFTWYNESLYFYRELITEAFLAEAPFVKGVYEKNRFDKKGVPTSQHLLGATAPEPLLVKENGVTFATYLDDGMMTGIFLDQKEVRGRLVDGMAQGMSVLNTFSYTGAFSVAAAIGGATETVSVDLAKRSRPKTEEMFEVNGLPLVTNKIVVMDVFEYFNYAKRKELTFDMIILDPPSFARNKKRTFSVAQDYGQLVGDVLPLLNAQGILIASTNAANVSLDKYTGMVEGAMNQQGRRFKRLASHRLPKDFAIDDNFKEGNYLKVLIYEVN